MCSSSVQSVVFGWCELAFGWCELAFGWCELCVNLLPIYTIFNPNYSGGKIKLDDLKYKIQMITS